MKDYGVRNIILPGEMKEIMNPILVAQKKAAVNVNMRRKGIASTEAC